MNHSFTARTLRILLQLILFAAFACPTPLLAQLPSKFSDKPEDFIKELGDFMTASKRPDLEEAYSVFKKYYKTGLVPPRKMVRIIKTANYLSEQKLSPFPYYKNYLTSVCFF
jgi:hypothetical protein